MNIFCSTPLSIKSFRHNFLHGKFINPTFPFKTVGVPHTSHNSCIIGHSRTLSKFSMTGIIFQEHICHKFESETTKTWNNYPWELNHVIYAVHTIWGRNTQFYYQVCVVQSALLRHPFSIKWDEGVWLVLIRDQEFSIHSRSQCSWWYWGNLFWIMSRWWPTFLHSMGLRMTHRCLWKPLCFLRQTWSLPV